MTPSSCRSQDRSASALDHTLPLSPAQAHRPGDRYPSTALTAPLNLGLAYNLDEVRSFFSASSDGDAEGDRTGISSRTKNGGPGAGGGKRASGLKKHLSSMRIRIPPSILVSRPQSDIDAEAKGTAGLGLGSRRISAFRSKSLDHLRVQDADTAPLRPGLNNDGTESLPSPLTASSDGFSDLGGDRDEKVVGGMGKVEFRIKRAAERVRRLWSKGGGLVRWFSGRGRRERRDRDRDREWVDDSLYSGT